MEPSTESEPQEAKPAKWCWFARWIRQERSPSQLTGFANSAQAALDAPHAPQKSTGGHGTLYRAGLTLAELKPDECGTVRRLFGPAMGRLRLLEMGLTPGTHIRMLRAAAFGGPLDILVRGYQLSLRREEAAGVWLDDPDDNAEGGLAMTNTIEQDVS
jgi:Fe2+ transport system protein FeoA